MIGGYDPHRDRVVPLTKASVPEGGRSSFLGSPRGLHRPGFFVVATYPLSTLPLVLASRV